ncbi:hypothetical protein J1N35_001411 [Gossypium stocksii]|uniref:RNase H type-1 domain-containing protein n=1 Tax=Gossypium stocksii TaxID=47602 RepID=A0A9D3WKC8_9ROSI|nr:hypothetical protein J1N35_001411 [Gossypium stocksii]
MKTFKGVLVEFLGFRQNYISSIGLVINSELLYAIDDDPERGGVRSCGDLYRRFGLSYEKIYSDGSIKSVDMFAAVGGLLQDHNGNWIVGFTRYLGNCEVIDSKLWGILDRLQIAFDRDFQKVIVRTTILKLLTSFMKEFVKVLILL